LPIDSEAKLSKSMELIFEKVGFVRIGWTTSNECPCHMLFSTAIG
jgi:hypothetical protein